MPSGNFRNYIDHYLAPHPSHEVKELFISTALLNFAIAAISLFEPIYLWNLGYSLSQIIIFNVAIYVAFFFLLPLGAKICRRHGNEHTILYSSPFLIVYYLAFFAIQYHIGFALVAIIAIALQKVLYWPGYHANFAQWSDGAEEGREVSNRQAIIAIVSIFAPVFGGFVITQYGFSVLFIFVSVIILMSNLPLLSTPERLDAQPFEYKKSMKRLVKKENRKRLFAFMGYGEEFIALILWPIFIVTIIPNLMSLAFVVSLAMFANALVTLYIGRLTDEGSKVAVLKTGVVYTTLSWLIRPLIAGGFGVFLIDSYYRVSKNAIDVPLTALIYDGARRHDIMESITFYEMALALGKIAAGLICLAVLQIFPDGWTIMFLVAAAFTVFFTLMPAEKWSDSKHS